MSLRTFYPAYCGTVVYYGHAECSVKTTAQKAQMVHRRRHDLSEQPGGNSFTLLMLKDTGAANIGVIMGTTQGLL